MDILLPDLVLESVFDIDLKALTRRGIAGILIDIDNTLVHWEESWMKQEFIDWIKLAEKDFKLCLVSNSLGQRAQSFAELLGIPAVGRALKPLNRAFLQAMALVGLEPVETAVIGDQLFTDILGGNRLNLYTILVNPLSSREFVTTRFVRRLERLVLRRLVRRNKLAAHILKIRQGGDGGNGEDL